MPETSRLSFVHGTSISTSLLQPAVITCRRTWPRQMMQGVTEIDAGHAVPGAAFVAIGLWGLWNTIKEYAKSPLRFETKAWFPAGFKGHWKYLELYLYIAGALTIILMQMTEMADYAPLAQDGSIPSTNIINFEHSNMCLFFLVYSSTALFTSVFEVSLPSGLLHLLLGLAYSQELLLLHLHNRHDSGIEGQYHWLLEIIVSVCTASTFLEIFVPGQALLPLVRSVAALFQGLWYLHLAALLTFPSLLPKGCGLGVIGVVRVAYAIKCDSEEASWRAKALATLEFNWYLASIIVSTLVLYSVNAKLQKAPAFVKIHQQEEAEWHLQL